MKGIYQRFHSLSLFSDEKFNHLLFYCNGANPGIALDCRTREPGFLLKAVRDFNSLMFISFSIAEPEY